MVTRYVEINLYPTPGYKKTYLYDREIKEYFINPKHWKSIRDSSIPMNIEII